MTVGQALERLDELRPGSPITERTKLCWLKELDGTLRAGLLAEYSRHFSAVGADTLWDEGLEDDDVLLVPEPFDGLYPHYLCAMTDAALGENDRYAGEMNRYNSLLGEFSLWLRKKWPHRAVRMRW